MGASTLLEQRWTTADLAALPDNQLYELIDGELFAMQSPHYYHQVTSGNIYRELSIWAETSGLGIPVINPGLLFTDTDNAIPDVVWTSNERLDALMDEAGHLTGAPELAVEVLSFGADQESRDRETKRTLYAQQGVLEYWIVDWRAEQVEVYRRMDNANALRLVATLQANDTLTTPLLPGFACLVSRFFTLLNRSRLNKATP